MPGQWARPTTGSNRVGDDFRLAGCLAAVHTQPVRTMGWNEGEALSDTLGVVSDGTNTPAQFIAGVRRCGPSLCIALNRLKRSSFCGLPCGVAPNDSSIDPAASRGGNERPRRVFTIYLDLIATEVCH